MNLYHLLNGDALLQQFPPSPPGEKLVVHECLTGFSGGTIRYWTKHNPFSFLPLCDFLSSAASWSG
jgi:hypothetical protein